MASSRKKRSSKPAPVPPKRGRGRPSKFTPEVRKRIADGARTGAYLDTCAAFGGISYDTLNEWLKRGDQVASSLPGDEDERLAAVDRLDPIDREYLDFSAAIKEARAQAEMQALLEIKQIAQGRAGRTVRTEAGEVVTVDERAPIWQAHAWFLERSFPHRYGRQSRAQLEEAPRGPAAGRPAVGGVPDADISDEERLKRLQQLIGAGA